MKGLIGGKPAPPDYMRGVMARAKRLRKATWPKKGRAVAVPGLGVFKPVDRAAKTGINPKTGEAIQIPAKRALKFKVSPTVYLNK